MRTSLLLFPLLFLLPGSALGATAQAAQTLVVSESGNGNVYAAGRSVSIIAPVAFDLSALGGSIMLSAPVSGDALFAGGSIDTRAPIAGDLRVFGGRVVVENSVQGDLVAVGGTVSVNAAPAYTLAAGAQVDLHGGSKGPVTVYGASVRLAGAFAGDVRVVASDNLSLAEGTVIHGVLQYDAPQQATIPTSAVIDGGVSYTGTSYLPTIEQAKTFAIAGAGVFFVVKVLALLIAVGLLAGLFLPFAQAVSDKALSRSFSNFVLLSLLGFGVSIATPVLIVLLFATFAGFAVAILVSAGFAFLLALGYLFAGILAGSALARGVVKRPKLLWRDAVIGMLVLLLAGIIPVFGSLVFAVLFAAAVGSIVSLAYRFVFPKDDLEL